MPVGKYRTSPMLSALTLLASSPAAFSAPSRNVETINVIGERQSAYTTDQVDSGTKLGLSVKETPQSISVVTQAQIDDFALVDINDVLNSTTGVFVQKVETDRNYYTARGFDIVNFQLDGLGLPLASGNDHGHTDMASFERIEVVRGANGLMTGVGNPSATINMVRKRPTDELQASVSVTAGSWDYKRVEGDASGTISTAVRGRLIVAKETKESYLDRYQLDKNVLHGVFEVDLTTTTSLTLGHTAQTSDADGNLWGALPLYYSDGTPTNFDASTSTSADWSYWNYTDNSSFAELKQSLSGDWTLLASYQHNRRREDSELFYVFGTPNRVTGAGLFGYASEYDARERTDLLDIYANGTFGFGGYRHELVMGASWAKLDQTAHSLYDYTTGSGFPTLPRLEDWTGDTPRPVFKDVAEGTTARDNGSDMNDEQRSVYATVRLSLGERLKAIIGARWDDWQSEGYSYSEPLGKEDRSLTPYLGITYDINDAFSGYASYTKAFSPQTKTDAEGARLDPLQGESYESGIKGSFFAEKVNATLAVFNVEQENVPLALPFVQGQPQRYRVADAVSNGIELEIVGEVAAGLNASLGLTKLDMDSADSLVEDYTPEQLLRVSAVYQLPMLPKLKIGGGIHWQDDMSREQGMVGEDFANAGDVIITRQESYALLNLLAIYELSDHVKISLNAENVSNEKYINSLYWQQGYYGPPRNAKVSLTLAL